MLSVHRCCLVDFVWLEAGLIVLGVWFKDSSWSGFGNCDRSFGRRMSAGWATGAFTSTGVLVLTVSTITLFGFTTPLHKFVGVIYLHVLVNVGDVWKDLKGRVI